MGTLAGQKVKDAYSSLLKLESGTITTSTKIIEDGAGNDSALKISSTTVEVAGVLNFGTVPQDGTSEVSALFLDSNNSIVKRSLSSGAFSTGESNSATAPIAISNNVISLSAPTTLPQLTESTVAIADSFFIYDANATAQKYITIQDLKDYINTGVTAAAAGSNTQVQFNNSGVLAGSQLFSFSTAALYYGGVDFVIREAGTGSASTFRRSESANVANGANNTIMFSVPIGSFKGMVLDYVVFIGNETRKRMGTFHVIWNSQSLSTTPISSDSISVQLGSTTSSEFTLSASVSSDSSSIDIRATNGVGEMMYFRSSVKLITANE